MAFPPQPDRASRRSGRPFRRQEPGRQWRQRVDQHFRLRGIAGRRLPDIARRVDGARKETIYSVRIDGDGFREAKGGVGEGFAGSELAPLAGSAPASEQKGAGGVFAFPVGGGDGDAERAAGDGCANGIGGRGTRREDGGRGEPQRPHP